MLQYSFSFLAFGDSRLHPPLFTFSCVAEIIQLLPLPTVAFCCIRLYKKTVEICPLSQYGINIRICIGLIKNQGQLLISKHCGLNGWVDQSSHLSLIFSSPSIYELTKNYWELWLNKPLRLQFSKIRSMTNERASHCPASIVRNFRYQETPTGNKLGNPRTLKRDQFVFQTIYFQKKSNV